MLSPFPHFDRRDPVVPARRDDGGYVRGADLGEGSTAVIDMLEDGEDYVAADLDGGKTVVHGPKCWPVVAAIVLESSPTVVDVFVQHNHFRVWCCVIGKIIRLNFERRNTVIPPAGHAWVLPGRIPAGGGTVEGDGGSTVVIVFVQHNLLVLSHLDRGYLVVPVERRTR